MRAARTPGVAGVALLVAVAVLAGCGGRAARDPADALPASSTALVRFERGAALTDAEARLARVGAPPARLRAVLAGVRLPPGHGRVYVARVPAGWVALLRPADPKAYAKRLGARPTARVRGWTVVARTQAAVDDVRHARAHLTDRPSFRAPAGGSLAEAWVAPAAAASLGLPSPAGLRWAALSLRADELTTRERAPSLGALAPTAAAAATDGAAVAFSGGPWHPWGEALPSLADAYGLDAAALRRELAPGSAVVLRPGDVLPELTFVGASARPAAVAHRVGSLLVRGATFAAPATVDGVALERFVLGAGEADDGAWDGRWAASTGTHGVVEAHDGGADLGLPAQAQGWVLVDTAAARQVAPAYDALAGRPQAERVLAALGPIRRLVGWATYGAGVETVTLRTR